MSQIRAASLIEVAPTPVLYDWPVAGLPPVWQTARYSMSFARSAVEMDAILRLRFTVFNLELGEGLTSSLLTGRDEDQFDRQCLHLLVRDRYTDEVIGTYRLQTNEHAQAGEGFYAATEFALDSLPPALLADAIELGRACIAKAHRHTEVFLLLWRGIAAYLHTSGKRYLFGCCSLASQDAAEAWVVARQLAEAGHQHPTLQVQPQPGFTCALIAPLLRHEQVELPKLLRCYLRFGAKVCGPPALDRQFKTIDFFVLLDAVAMDARLRRLLASE